MSKQKNHFLQKLFTKKNIFTHLFIVILVGLGVFGIIQSTKAQSGGGGFSVVNTQFPVINKNIGKYITTLNFGSIKLSNSGTIDNFRWNWNNINTKLYDTGINLVYFNNFDTQESLEENLVPLADSIRDFTGGINGNGKNGWSYWYKYNSQTQIQQYCDSKYTHICFSCDLSTFDPYCNNVMLTGFTSSIDETSLIQECESGYTVCEECNGSQGDCISPYNPQVRNFFPKAYADAPIGGFVGYNCITYGPGEEVTCELRILQTGISLYDTLTYNLGTNLRTIGTEPIINHNFANIGKKYAHPGSGTNSSLSELSGLNNIPIIRQRTSNLSGKLKIINTLSDDANACGNGIKYYIYTGIILTDGTLTGKRNITGYTLPNLFPEFTIEKEINIISGNSIFFEIDNNENNECDGTRNHIQIYDITDGGQISGPPTINPNGKYGGALEFNGTHQKYSLTGVNQGSGITISAWIKTNNMTKTQAIVTKKNSYGIILKNGKIRVSPSTYWMRHDTGIPVTTDRTHITRTYDGQQINVYKNGGSGNVGGASWSYSISGNLTNSPNQTFIGYDETNTGRGRDGLIDEIRIYNIGITSGEAQQLYESNLKVVGGNNSYREFIINKTGLNDGIYNYTGLYSGLSKTGTIIVDTSGPIVIISGNTNDESKSLNINISGTDISGINGYQRRRYLDNERTNRTNWTMNSGFSIPAKDEPTTGILEINVKDNIGWITNRTGIIERRNTLPYLIGTTYKSGLIEDDIIFSVTAIDTGTSISYQWYLSGNGDFNIIAGATGSSYTISRNQSGRENIKVIVQDSQGASSELIFEGEWFPVNELPIIYNGNSGYTIPNSGYTGQLAITGNIKNSGSIGRCSNDDNFTYYTGYLTGIGNDYCIIQSGGQEIVLGWYGVNRNKTIFTFTGIKNNQFVFEFQNTHLTGLTRAISGTDNNTTGTYSIFDQNLLGLYNFDKILLADSDLDFMPIQGGKNRLYLRKPKGVQDYTGLQYNAITKKWIIGVTENQEPELFIDNKLINPGHLYGDAVIGRTSPVSAKVLLEYSLELDPNSNKNCGGNGIKYTLKINTGVIETGEIVNISTATINNKIIDIKKSDSLFFEINSKSENNCDIILYNIRIYQLPETNIASGTESTNIGGNYVQNGKYNGALEFIDNNSFVSISNGIYAPEMSISLRAYKTSNNSPQTIIEKRGSYGLVISGNKLHIVNNYTLHNTQIEIPNNTWTHIGRSQNGQTAKIYINGKLEYTKFGLSNLVPNSNSTQIGYLYPHGQRNGMLDEIYIYSGEISSGHFATLYEHNLNKIAWDKRTWTNNESGPIHEGEFNFTLTTTSQDGSTYSTSYHNFVTIQGETIYTTGINVNGEHTAGINITGIIIHPGTKGTCTMSNDNEKIIYTANPQTIGNDYCIIQTGINVNSRVVLWFNNININKTFFSITGTLFQQQRLLSPTSNPFAINILSNKLSELIQNLSGTNNTNIISGNIYTGLLAMYNFDKILLTDSQTDFGPIQNYKGREYQRKQRLKQNFDTLQYDPVSQQRLVSRPVQEYDGMFIKTNTLNPGYDYGDIVLKRTSPFDANIEINLSLSDAIANCGDGIKYDILRGTTNIHSGSYGNHTIQTTISNSESLYFKINSSGNNLCDTTNYRIQIYQLPETNIAENKTLSVNSGAQYTTEGKKGGAFSFANTNQFIRLGTGLVNTSGMSIVFWINPENTNGNQTIIQKVGSYGITLSNGIIYVTNKSTQQRFDTQVSIEENKRTHIGRSYDSLNMKLYKNGKEVRKKYIGGSIGLSANNTIIGYSTEHGQFKGKIDELYIYKYAISEQILGLLHQFNLNRIGPYNRSLTENKDAFSNGLYDGRSRYHITGSNDNTGLDMIIDFNGPIIKEINGLTGRESQNLTITGILYDSGSLFSGYQRRTIINQSATIRSQRNNSSNFTITIPAQIEPTTGILEIKTKDIFGHELISTNNIFWQNTGPLVTHNQVYEYVTKIGSNITFVANVIDEGSNLTYQRYSGHNCIDPLIEETNSIFITGNNSEAIKTYSLKAFDNYQEPSVCANLTGTRVDEPPFPNLTVYITGDGKGGLISGNLNNLLGSSTGDKIITNGNKGICKLSTDKTEIIYTRSQEYQGNDSCILQLENNEYILLAFIDISTGFYQKRTPKIQEITNQTDINLVGNIYIPKITNFIIKRFGETTQGSGVIDKTITGQDNNILRKYSFDKILITDSTEDFGKFKNEYSWNYFRDNGTTTGDFTFNPRTQSRIINEPLQDYEYIFISSGEIYPGATKYGNIVYERTSSISGNIDIESQINNKNPGYCTNTDGIIYSIKKGNDYQTNNTIYTKDLLNLTENSTIGTTISSGEKLYFIINSKNNNQCDKVSLNAKIYFNPINDFSTTEQTLQTSGVTYSPTGRFGGAYDFSIDGSFFDIGRINKSTGLTFNTRIKINGTSNQTIIYKEGSYGLVIKDGSVKITTDGGRWYNTNSETTSKLTNGQRNYLSWTYDGTNMYIFINGEQTRTNRIVGYYPTNGNPTIIGRSINHGQLKGSIDELQVRNKFITANEAKDLYNTHFRKLNLDTWNFTFSQKGLADGIYTITGVINGNNIFTGKTIIDNKAPIIEFLGYTGNETEYLNIELTGYDEGTNISGFTYKYKIPNTASWSNTITRNRLDSGNYIIISGQNEPISGTLEIEIRDQSNNKKTYTQIIERLNIPIITDSLFITGQEGSTITFTASGYDPGGTTNTGYQWFFSPDCQTGTAITGANQKTFTTGRNEPSIVEFSYKMRDAQNLRSECVIVTGNRINIVPIVKDLYINSSGNYTIIFNATGYDPGGTIFSGAWFTGNSCTGEIISTGLTLTTSSTKSGTYEFSYYLRDAQGATGINNINTSRECQIATGYRPYLNPIAEDFVISTNTTNKIATGNRKSSSNARDLEYNTSITAIVSSGSKGYCQITNNRISFQPIVNNTGTGFCELILTDGNNRSTTIRAYALNIDTTAPTTTITTGDYKTFELLYNDTSTGTSYYKTLTGVRNVTSCGTSGYTPYISGSTINIIYTPGITDYRTVCYYSEDVHGNKENTKTQLFTQPRDAIPFNVIFSSNPFMNDIFEATITTNKNCTGTLTGLDEVKILSLSAGTHTITGSFIEKNGQKTAYITLQTQNTGDIFSRAHTFTIDQTAPSTPIIIEQTENNNYYIIRRNPSTDDISGIKGYNYEINNQYTKVKEGFTDVTYLNILKSEVQYNSWISIKVQSQDKVSNVSQRSSPISITIPQQQIQETIIDTEPNQFTFTKTTNAKRNTMYTSNEIVIGGLSNNTYIPIRLSTGTLFINDSKINNNSGLVKNGDIVYIQLYSSDLYNESTHATLVANGVSATYTITTESKVTKTSTTSFLEELRRLLEQIQKEETSTTTTSSTTDTTIDTKRVSAPHIAPNGKTYNLYKTIDGRYSSHNFIVKRYFTSLSEMKAYIDKNNPK